MKMPFDVRVSERFFLVPLVRTMMRLDCVKISGNSMGFGFWV